MTSEHLPEDNRNIHDVEMDLFNKIFDLDTPNEEIIEANEYLKYKRKEAYGPLYEEPSEEISSSALSKLTDTQIMELPEERLKFMLSHPSFSDIDYPTLTRIADLRSGRKKPKD